MGTISLQIPQSGLPNSTEDPKVASDLTTIQTAINGNLDDTNLFAPNNGVRRLVLQSTVGVTNSIGTGTYLISQFQPVASGGAATPDIWYGDVGLSSQPQDFQVANKTAYARLRVSGGTNGVSFGTITIVFGLYPVSAFDGSSASTTVTLGTVLAGSTVTFTNPTTNLQIAGESTQFALPSSSTAYVIGFTTSAPLPTNAAATLTAQLYAYNA